MDPMEYVEFKVVSRKRNRKQKPAVQAANGNLANGDIVFRSLEEQAADVEAESNGAVAARNQNLQAKETEKPIPNKEKKPVREVSFAETADVEDESNGAVAARNQNLQAEETEKPKPNKEKKPEPVRVREVSFAEAAAKIGPSDLADFLVQVPDPYPPLPMFRVMRFLDYYGRALSGVTCPWYEMFKPSRLSKLFDVIDVPLSHIPDPVYKTSVDWLNQHVSDDLLGGFVSWSFKHILKDVFQGPNGWKEGRKPTCKSNMAIFVAVAMVLRSKPYVFTNSLPKLRMSPRYQGKCMVPLTVWMISQASQDNLSVGLYSWARNLLPLVGSNPQSRHLILKFVEKILSKQDARTILTDAPVWKGERLIPPPSFGILLRLTFPVPSARVKATSRFEAIYPLLKEMALAGEPESEAMIEVTQQIFTLSLRLAGEGIRNPVLAKEATEIAIWFLTKNVGCWKHWDKLYRKNLTASVALLKSLVEKWKDHSPKLSSSSRKAMKLVTQKIFNFSLELAQGNHVVAKEAIWSLTELLDCCKCWDNLYKENLEASVALLKKLVDKRKDYFLKPSYDIFTGAAGIKAMNEVTQQMFTFSLKLAKEGNPVLAKEATTIAIWSLIENVDCWKCWNNLYMENLEASVALLKKLVDEWKDHSHKLSSSPSDTLTLSQTMESFMLKNKKAITERRANGSLYKEADKSCKVISERLSRGRSSRRGSPITAVVLAAIGALLVYSNLETATDLKNLVNSLELHLYVNAFIRGFKN